MFFSPNVTMFYDNALDTENNQLCERTFKLRLPNVKPLNKRMKTALKGK